MKKELQRNLVRTARTTTLYILVAGVAMVILFPIYFLVTMSLMSDFEMYNEWPLPMLPSFSMSFKLQNSQKGYLLSIYNKVDNTYLDMLDTNDTGYIINFVKRKTNCTLTREKLNEIIEELKNNSKVEFKLRKNFLLNYTLFFRLKKDAWPAFLRSIYTAVVTILISLSIGGMGGYAFSRYFFKGKNFLKLGVLFVRMFPAVATAIPAAIILGNMGLYDKPIGLAFIYSIGSIGLTIWITASIFLSIPVELEEAAQIFGTSKAGAFWHVTLPLALPGLAACAMYAFIGSWNEYAQAIILTQFNPTFPVVVFEYVLGATGMAHLATAGGMTLAIPAVIFYLFIRRYILRMWGGVRV
ncbi:MAG: carbohydrate ABC transporter permease [Spirochaetes bacterium]|nr:carbohydrate ABC transporter permease [Spirochaetota bacterium]